MRVVVDAPSRLHLGFLDLDGACGRRFGSLGLALDRPRLVVEARPRALGSIEDSALEALRARLEAALGREVAVCLRIREALPRHAGFGSGTQLELAAASAVAELLGDPVSPRELAGRLGRGRRSGVGISVFERGGFVVDGGHRWPSGSGPGPGSPERGDDLPPVLARHPVPEDWRLVLATPHGAAGLAGSGEEVAFRRLPSMPEAVVGRICRLVLLQVLPGVATADIRAFGQGVTEIQALVGEHFAALQGGRYATSLGEAVAALALREGAHGVGQSSWGPTVFALVEGDGAAAALAAAIEALVGQGGTVTWSRPRNHGAVIRVEP